jgi:hypothetical protein
MEINRDNTKLENHVMNIINESIDGGDYSFEDFINDLIKYGCQSGMVGELIYYNDTENFYDNHQEEIDQLLAEFIDETGMQPFELFGDKWDKSDPLARETNNVNLLAWFGFEETAFRLAREQGIEV